jgi:hypothetical protein
MPTNIRDPRTIVTPDAFEVSPGLLGLPLARPAHRLGAMLVDLTIIGILTALLTDVQLVLWGTVALILLYAALKRPRAQTMGTHAATLVRISLGCLGVGILSIVLVVSAVLVLRDGDDPVELSIGERDVGELVTELVGAGGVVARAAESLQEAETDAEAEQAAAELVASLPEIGLSREQRLDLLLEMTPVNAPWRGRAEAIYRRALDAGREGAAQPPPPPGTAAGREASGSPGSLADTGAGAAPDTAAPEDGTGAQDSVPVDSLTPGEALREYAALVTAGAVDAQGRAGGSGSERADALRRRLLPLVGGDTLEALVETIDDAREEQGELEDEVERLREESGGFVPFLRDVWDQLGSAIGLWSLYFTVLLTLWKGQTVGKRLFGLRVLRLDGEPLGWWSSFERVGGYAAGIATGLLGFAQVFWDSNRQCVHDKIVGTVVVMDGAPPLPGGWVQARLPGTGSDAEDAPGEEV